MPVVKHKLRKVGRYKIRNEETKTVSVVEVSKDVDGVLWFRVGSLVNWNLVTDIKVKYTVLERLV